MGHLSRWRLEAMLGLDGGFLEVSPTRFCRLLTGMVRPPRIELWLRVPKSSQFTGANILQIIF